MDQVAAKERLGLGATATAERVEAAYKRRSRVLKRRLVEAGTVEERERYRGALRSLLYVREIALGAEAAAVLQAERRRRAERKAGHSDWWSPAAGVPDRIRTRESALAFFGLGHDAAADEVRQAFFRRSRVLKREIAHARTDADLGFFQETLRRLNALLHLCLAPAGTEPAGEPAGPPDHDVTRTELGPIFERAGPESGPEIEVPDRGREERNPLLYDSLWDIDIETELLKTAPPREEETDS